MDQWLALKSENESTVKRRKLLPTKKLSSKSSVTEKADGKGFFSKYLTSPSSEGNDEKEGFFNRYLHKSSSGEKDEGTGFSISWSLSFSYSGESKV